MGWTKIVSNVDKDGNPTGGFLVPTEYKELIAALVAYIKEPINPKDVVREAERIIENARPLDKA